MTVTKRAWLIALVGLVGVAAVATVIALVVSSTDSSPSTPTEVLDEARDFIADAKGVVYTGEFEVEATDPQSEGSGFVQRGSFEESAIFPDRGRSVIDFNGVATETLFIDDERYARDAESIEALTDERFGHIDVDELDDIAVELDPDFLFDKPQALGRVFRQARDQRITRRSDDRTVLRVQLPPGLLPSLGAAASIDDVEGVLVLRDEGLPERLELRAHGAGPSLSMGLEFLDWDAPLPIAEPDEADLDPTPFIDEERVAAYDDTPVYQPAAIPTGWELKLAEVITEEQSFLGCRQVSLVFASSDPGKAGVIFLGLMPTSCSSGAPPGSDEFVVGPYRGWVADDPSTGSGVAAQLDVDGTAIQVSSDLTREQVAEVLSVLVPLDLENPPPATISLAEAV